jgi:arsenite/tail-anchored protein-transporting ATPase
VRVLLFTGKGGVGKTTTAAATAVSAARRGTKTLVLSTDSAHSLSDALAVRLGADPTEVEPGLFGQQVDPRARMERSWRGIQDYLLQLLDVVGVDPLAAEELTVLPGAEEVLALLEVRDQVREGPWDLVVVDCAPTAETLRLLALPEAVGWYLDRVTSSQRRLARAVGPMVGRRVPVPRDPVVDAVRRLRAELADVRTVLTAPATSVRLVLTPEAVVVAEARRTLTSLALHGYPVDGVVANRIVPAGDDPWRAAWARTQARVLQEVEESFAPAPVLRSAYLETEPVGPDALAELARSLYDGPGARGHDPVEGTHARAPLVVHRSGDEFVLELRLPLAQRRDVDLARRGDEIVVSVGSARRIIALPSALRRCTVAGASFREGTLRVRFEPDPALWRPL